MRYIKITVELIRATGIDGNWLFVRIPFNNGRELFTVAHSN